MAVNKSATYTTPDGVERTLRFTKASQFRLSTLSEKHGGTPDYLIAWSMMFDEDGNGPKFPEGHAKAGQQMSADWLGANLSPTDTPALLSAISEATTGTGLEKKTLETLERIANEETQRISGLIAGLSRDLISALPEVPPVQNGSSANSGGSHPENSTPSNDATPSESETPISVPV